MKRRFRKDFIHGHLNPSNILYKKYNGKYIFKIAGLGSFRIEELIRPNKNGEFTYSYRSPQQFLRKTPRFTNKADVYATGVIFF